MGVDAPSLDRVPGGLQVRLGPSAGLALNLQPLEPGEAIHLVHYGYDAARVCLPERPSLEIDLRPPEGFGRLEVHAPGVPPEASLAIVGTMHRLTLRRVPLYTMIVLRHKPPPAAPTGGQA